MSAGGGLRKRNCLPDPKLPRQTVDDTSLSFRALGLLLWIMSRPNGWVIRSDQMAKEDKRSSGPTLNGHKSRGVNSKGNEHRREGKEAIRTALLDELGAEGYYRLERRRMLDGSVQMGTAASEFRVESWAAQYRLFGRNPVPMVQQPDGTYLVRLPDGQLVPDDCPPDDLPTQDPVEAEEYSDETPGQTGAQKPGPGNLDTPGEIGLPGPGFPAPVNPASGNPASGNLAPLGREVIKGVTKEDPPHPPGSQDGAAVSPRPGQRGGESSSQDTDDKLGEIVTWFVHRRPDWPRAAIEDALTTSVARDLGTLGEAAQALRELAEGKHGDTDSPRRLYALPSAEWWAAARAKRSRAAAAALAASPRCSKRGHGHQPATGCSLCAGEGKGLMVEDHPLPEGEALARGSRYLPKSVRRRRAPAEPVAS